MKSTGPYSFNTRRTSAALESLKSRSSTISTSSSRSLAVSPRKASKKRAVKNGSLCVTATTRTGLVPLVIAFSPRQRDQRSAASAAYQKVPRPKQISGPVCEMDHGKYHARCESHRQSPAPGDDRGADEVGGPVGPQREQEQDARGTEPRREQRREYHGGEEERGDKLARGHDGPNLTRDERLEVAVLEEHPPQLAERRARVVCGDDPGYEQHASTRPEHPEGEFGVLTSQ